MRQITISPEVVRDAIRAGDSGVIVHQSERWDDWAAGGHIAHYEEQIATGWLTVAVTAKDIALLIGDGIIDDDATIANIVSALNQAINPVPVSTE